MANKVSIIVPVYNCDKFLRKCIASLCKQDYPNLEILLLDDGSKDSSYEICKEYAKKDSRIRLIHKDNSGVSATRNQGIDEAAGDYLMFVDGDDYIDSDMVSHLMNAMTKQKAQAAVCGLYHEYEDNTVKFPKEPVTKVTDGVKGVKEVLINHIATAGPVCKLFQKELFENIKFPKDLTVGEDALCMIQALYEADKVVFDTAPKYHYVHREESLMTSAFSIRSMDLIKAYGRIGEFLRGEESLRDEVEFRIFWAHFHVLDQILSDKGKHKKEQKEIVTFLRKNKKKIWDNPYVGPGRKVAMGGLALSTWIYKRVIFMRERKKNHKS